MALKIEARAVFEHFGFVEGHQTSTVDGRRVPSSRPFALALESMGPLVASFGRYLATRTDLLAVPDRESLWAAERPPEPIRPATLERIVARDGSGADLELALEAPTRSLLWLSAEARRFDESVSLKVLRPGVEGSVVDDLDLLHSVGKVELVGVDGRPIDLSTALDDFLLWLPLQIDLGHELAALERVATAEARLGVAETLPELCTRSLLATRKTTSERIAAAHGAAGQVWRDLAFAWLELVFDHGLLVQEMDANNVEQEPGGKLVLIGGGCLELSGSERESLSSYLCAVADGEVDLAVAALLRLSVRGAETAATGPLDKCESELRSVLRQAVPYREFGMGDARAIATLADTLAMSARLARRVLPAPGSAWVAFCRGIAALDRMQLETCSSEPGSPAEGRAEDFLVAALQRYRLRRAGRDTMALFAPGVWQRSLAEAAPAVLRRLESEQVVADEAARLRQSETRSGWSDSFSGSSTLAAALMAASMVLMVLAWKQVLSTAWILWIVAPILVFGVALLVTGSQPKEGGSR